MGNVHSSSVARCKDSLLVVIEIFCQLSRLRRYERILIEIVVFKRGVGYSERKFQGEWRGPYTNDS